ncbi:MAG TPA: hypothetical protein DCG69_08285 [Bacteroidales bacterium]|nr:hypothetical protein [Bacteroidales bacterium]
MMSAVFHFSKAQDSQVNRHQLINKSELGENLRQWWETKYRPNETNGQTLKRKVFCYRDQSLGKTKKNKDYQPAE